MRNFNLFCCLVLCMGTVHAENSVLLSKLVPTIRQSGYNLLPYENEYQLILTHPDGSNSQKTVTFDTNEETGQQALQVVGNIVLIFPDTKGKAEIIYNAGPNGNNVKYKYSLDRPTGITKKGYASKEYLKSAAG